MTSTYLLTDGTECDLADVVFDISPADLPLGALFFGLSDDEPPTLLDKAVMAVEFETNHGH